MCLATRGCDVDETTRGDERVLDHGNVAEVPIRCVGCGAELTQVEV